MSVTAFHSPTLEAGQVSTREWFTASLPAITAAVVGAILRLTLFFGCHVLWPRGLVGPLDVVTAGLTITAVVLLMRIRMSVARVIVVCALADLLLRLYGRCRSPE